MKRPKLRFLPIPAMEGWWHDPEDPGKTQARYHDGRDWTDYVCRFSDGQWEPVRRSPLQGAASFLKPVTAPELERLPEPLAFAMPTPTPLREGWWEDPATPGSVNLRYHDGRGWTNFIARRKFRGSPVVFRSSFDDARAFEALRKEQLAQEPDISFSLSLPYPFVGAAGLAVVLMLVSPFLASDTSAYEWTGRIGTLLAVALLLVVCVTVAVSTLNSGAKGELRWLMLAEAAVGLPMFMFVRGWDRVLEAFGVR